MGLQRDDTFCCWEKHRVSRHSSLKGLTILINLFKISLCLMCKKSLGGGEVRYLNEGAEIEYV